MIEGAKIADWQVERDEPDLGPACDLFKASERAFSALLQALAVHVVQVESGTYESLRNEFMKYYMWNEGLSTRSGNLDSILSSSTNLKGTVLRLMVQWAKSVLKSTLAIRFCHSH
jgi:hypothetical protein